MKNSLGKEYKIANQVDVNGKMMLIIELDSARYIDGLLTKHVICNPSQFDKFSQVTDKVEVVND